METVLRLLKKIIPAHIFTGAQPAYHYLLAFLGALIYRFPSRKIKVVAITGTKGKSTTAELVNAILEEAGYKTALAGTIRFKIADKSTPNLYKMTLPGRFFVQRFLRNAVNAGCDYAVLEITSEAAKQYRHKFVELNALIFLNLAPEHIESHGSYEKYRDAKLSLARALEKSSKRPRAVVANADDKEGWRFLETKVEQCVPFHVSVSDLAGVTPDGIHFSWKGELINSKLIGAFNLSNMLASASFANTQNIPASAVKRGIEKVSEVSGRVQFIRAGQDFDVIVDYAHTPDSLEKLYQAFPHRKKIAILGNTGGGRDTWKRPVMAGIAEKYCDEIILTNEDPYDEDPRKILEEMAVGMKIKKPEIILDRREAIATALRLASNEAERLAQDGNKHNRTVVLISGKGTDPYIMEANNKKTPWSDRNVAEEELKKLATNSTSR